MMKRIPLTQGKFALVDDEDYERITALGKWHYHRGYAIKTKRIKKNGKWGSYVIRMHREILGFDGSLEIDHINLNKCDNRKQNLRFCTRTENILNRRIQRNNTTGYHGVTWNKRLQKFNARIGVDKQRLHLGYFENEIEAARAYNEASIKYHGSFAKLNAL